MTRKNYTINTTNFDNQQEVTQLVFGAHDKLSDARQLIHELMMACLNHEVETDAKNENWETYKLLSKNYEALGKMMDKVLWTEVNY